MSEIEHNHINEKLTKHEEGLEGCIKKVNKLEVNTAQTLIQIDFLIKEISELSDSIKEISSGLKKTTSWAITILLGFLIWYIQGL